MSSTGKEGSAVVHDPEGLAGHDLAEFIGSLSLEVVPGIDSDIPGRNVGLVDDRGRPVVVVGIVVGVEDGPDQLVESSYLRGDVGAASASTPVS